MQALTLQSLTKWISRPLFSQYNAKKPDVTVWNTLLQIKDSKWAVSFFFNHPTIQETYSRKYAIYSNSTFGFSMVEQELQFVKGSKRHVYTLGFRDALKMCFLEPVHNQSILFNRVIPNPSGNPLEPCLKRHIRIKAANDETTFSMFESYDTFESVQNIKKFTIKLEEFGFLCEVIKNGVTELSGLDAQFVMIHGSDLNEQAHEQIHMEHERYQLAPQRNFQAYIV